MDPSPTEGFCNISIVILASQSCSCIKGGAQRHPPPPPSPRAPLPCWGEGHLRGGAGVLLGAPTLQKSLVGLVEVLLLAAVGSQWDRVAHALRRCTSIACVAAQHRGARHTGW